jgi:pSer/pThr/pTyr-binding forkhead associated (FHA) protein
LSGNSDQTRDENSTETTSILDTDLLGEVDASAPSVGEGVPPGGGLPSDAALLLVKRGPNAGSRFLLDRAATSVGRHPASDIFLDDVTASRRHAEFRRENGQFRVVDVGSLNGTFVNNQPVQSSSLANGDEIQIGKFRLVFLVTMP